MDLTVLAVRLQEIETAIVTTSNQLNALYGHKTEVMHWMQQLQSPKPEDNATQVESEVDCCEEVPVE